jgi:hypothetical protein
MGDASRHLKPLSWRSVRLGCQLRARVEDRVWVVGGDEVKLLSGRGWQAYQRNLGLWATAE